MSSDKYAAVPSVAIKGFGNRFQEFQKNNPFCFFVYLQLQFQSTEKPDLWIFSWNVELQSGINSKNLIAALYQTSARPAFPEINIPCFAIMLYYNFLTVCTFVNYCFQGWVKYGKSKILSKVLSTLRTH